MISHELTSNPTAKERRSLAFALVVLAGVLGAAIWFRPGGLLVFTVVSGTAWCASMLFYYGESLGCRWKGVLLPIVSSLIYAAAINRDAPGMTTAVVATALATLAVFVWLREDFGNRFYDVWTQLFLPLAWSVSTLLLILVYYGVVTPIGLMLRIAGRDSMQRKFDRGATTYWIAREAPADPERYFRQF